MPLKVEPILPRFGAECSGLDLTRPLSPDEVRQVTDAMDTWGVTVWRNTGMNDDQHVEFSRNFGFLERVPRREGVRFKDLAGVRAGQHATTNKPLQELHGGLTSRDSEVSGGRGVVETAVSGNNPSASTK